MKLNRPKEDANITGLCGRARVKSAMGIPSTSIRRSITFTLVIKNGYEFSASTPYGWNRHGGTTSEWRGGQPVRLYGSHASRSIGNVGYVQDEQSDAADADWLICYAGTDNTTNTIDYFPKDGSLAERAAQP
ncbi:MAG: hypothetical protein U0Y68_11690 [Blastocatellia bacterium]